MKDFGRSIAVLGNVFLAGLMAQANTTITNWMALALAASSLLLAGILFRRSVCAHA